MDMQDRITPENITELKENEIFVYGANRRGVHGAGAAKLALTWGAKMGEDKFNGQTYGISTKDWYLETLSTYEIRKEINIFLNFVKTRTDLTFLVTKIGCGLSGYAPEDIAPLFDADDLKQFTNVHLPKEFWDIFVDSNK
jgi:hypothetical protein